MFEKDQAIYVAIFNSFANPHETLTHYSEELERRFPSGCSVSLVNGDTLCFHGLTGPEISALMEATGSDYNYSYDSPEDAWNSEEHCANPSDRGSIYGYECGVLLTKDDQEYKQYSCNNPALPYGFYDEDQGFCSESGLVGMREKLRKYVETGVDKTYAIISFQGLCDESQMTELLECQDVSAMDYSYFRSPADVVYSVCKIDGEIVEGFLENLITESFKLTAYYSDREDMSEDEHRAYVSFWFDEYERTGFAGVFDTPYKDQKQYVGQTFEVLGRCGEGTHDLEVLPVWRIRLECGIEIEAFPEEICILERNPQNRITPPSLSDQIDFAASRATDRPSALNSKALEPEASR